MAMLVITRGYLLYIYIILPIKNGLPISSMVDLSMANC